MPSRKCGACGRREIGRMSRISRTLRMPMPNVSPARPSVRYCAVSAMLRSSILELLENGADPIGTAPSRHVLALKFGVAMVFAVTHRKGKPATAIGRPHRACRLGRGRLLGAAIDGLHGRHLGAELADRTVDRRFGLARGRGFDAEIGD